jgi:phosphoglycolate phosphatase
MDYEAFSRIPYPKVIIFDWDGTLVNTHDLINSALCHTLEKMGHKPWSPEDFALLPGHSLKNLFPDLFGEKADQATLYFYDYIQSQHLKTLTPMDGVQDLLSYLFHDLAIPLGIVSNKKGILLRKEVEHLKWDQYFCKIVGSLDTPKDKPSILPVQEVLKEVQIDMGEHVWFLGDALVDMECAHKSQSTFILVENKDLMQNSSVNPIKFYLPHSSVLKKVLASRAPQ